MEFRDYREAEAFLLDFVNYEAGTKWPTYDTHNLDIERFEGLLTRIGSPHRRPRIIHVAGTKGKGSTCAMLASIFSACGLKTGLYTSPHFVSFRERVRIDGEMIAEDDFVRLVGAIASEADASPDPGANNYRTTFEILTAVALKHFAEQECDAVVVETGLGGRLDATNVVFSELTIITALGLDHQHILGDTLADIAREKAGIVKPGIPCVLSAQTPASERAAAPVVEAICAERGSRLVRSGWGSGLTVSDSSDIGMRLIWSSEMTEGREVGLSAPIVGVHQVNNLRAALTAVELLSGIGWPLRTEGVRKGLSNLSLFARCEVVGLEPLFVLDAAHCPMSMRATTLAVTSQWPDRDVLVCYSCLSDKNTRETLAELAKIPRLRGLFVFPAPSPRAMEADEIARLWEGSAPVHLASSPEVALSQALAEASRDALVLATGSFYSADRLRNAYNK